MTSPRVRRGQLQSPSTMRGGGGSVRYVWLLVFLVSITTVLVLSSRIANHEKQAPGINISSGGAAGGGGGGGGGAAASHSEPRSVLAVSQQAAHAGAYAEPEALLPRSVIGNGDLTCGRGSNDALTLTTDGQRCFFPFRVNGTWHNDCSAGFCATNVDAIGRAILIGECSNRGTPVDVACEGVLDAVKCDNTPIDGATCTSVVEGGTCLCGSPSKPGEQYKVALTKCKRTDCDRVCKYYAADAMSATHSERTENGDNRTIDFLLEMVNTANRFVPDMMNFGQKWKEFVDEVDNTKPFAANPYWCGRGIVFMAGSPSTLPQVLAAVKFMRVHLMSNLPVEVWQTHTEVTDMGPAMKQGLRRLGIVLRTLPKELISDVTNDLFALKPAAVLASSFDEVLFFDSDALPVADPNEIFEQRLADESAVFWPDLWTLLYDAAIFDTVRWPYPGAKIGPSQESGIMVICKSCGGWKPLTLALYFNYFAGVYYEAIYFGHMNERACKGCGGKHGHSAPGRGDKDTFHIAWLAVNEKYTMMGPAALGGVPIQHGHLCGSSFIHRSRNGKFLALHHNSNKWTWRDFRNGLFVTTGYGMHLSHYAVYNDPSTAFNADGINLFKSVTYSTRHDAGQQAPPPGTRWCIVYKGDLTMDTVESYTGWDFQHVLAGYMSDMYTSPWLVEWVLENTWETPAQKCIRTKHYVADREMLQMTDVDLRNTMIVRLHEDGKGPIPVLQGLSDRALAEICYGNAPPVTAAPRRRHRRHKTQQH